MKNRMVLLHHSLIGIHLIICARGILAICPTTWDEYNDNCYKVLSTASSFTHSDAKQACEAENSRANLVMPKTVFENMYIEINIDYGDTLWLGLTDIDVDGSFFWDDGTKLLATDYAEWDELQPDNNDAENRDENCVIAQYGDWHDKPCILNAGVMCQMTLESEVEPTTQSTLPTIAKPSTLFTTETDIADEYSTTLANTDALFSAESSLADVTITTESSNQYTSFSTEPISADPTSTKGSVNTVGTTNLDTSTQNTISIQYCTCPCSFHTTPTPIKLEDILNDIRVQKELLSSEIRKRLSAPDSRMSSFCIGCTGVTVLIACVLFIICLDCSPKRNASYTF